MCSLFQHSINHFFEIEVIQPRFDKLYSKYKKLVGDEGSTTSKGDKQKINFFNMPQGCSNKVKVLLKEINKLPANNKYPNLIAHQLRTILSLILIEYWEKINTKVLPSDKKDSLQRLIQYTVTYAVPEKLKQAKFVAKELNEMKANKTKELADDVVHCNYSLTTNEKIVDEFCKNIKHLLSLIYGR